MSAPQLHSRNWFGKASAGLIAGFSLSIALTSLFSWALVNGDPLVDARGQVAMWLVAPIWCAFLSLCFLFRDGLRAWAWLGGSGIVLWALYALCRLGG